MEGENCLRKATDCRPVVSFFSPYLRRETRPVTENCQGLDSGTTRTERRAPVGYHNVMLLLKQSSFESPAWSTLCEDTQTLSRAISSGIAIRCFNPVIQTIGEQVMESLKSSLIVTEHGATSYGALCGHDGVVLLSIASRKEVKDTHIDLYANHYETSYFASEDKETTFEGMLRFTLANGTFRL